MKILHVTGGQLFGGVETFQLTWTDVSRRHFPRTEHHFGVLFAGAFWDALQASNIPATRLLAVSFSKPGTVIRANLQLRRLLRSIVPDLVVLYSSWTQVLFSSLIRHLNIPVVIYENNTRNNQWPDRASRFFKVDGVVAVTEAVRADWAPITRLWNCPVTVVHCPVQLRAVPRKESRDKNRPLVIFVAARMQPWKGHAVLLGALARLKTSVGWICRLAGGPQTRVEQTYFDALVRQAADLGIANRVQFLGQRSDVLELLSEADIYCQPNLEPEGLGISFVEAMAAGLPVITTDLGPAQEVVGEAGILVPANDLQATANALTLLLEDPDRRASYQVLGPARAKLICDPVARVGDVELFLKSVLENHRRSATCH